MRMISEPQTIYFAHGNGFPSLSYNKLLQQLREHYIVDYIPQVGHDPEYPVADNWVTLVDEVIVNIEQGGHTNLIGLGHSLGGVLLLLASIKRRDLFKAVILLDSPLISRSKSQVIKWAKRLGFISRLTPAYRTLTRRKCWPTPQDAFDYYHGRSVFKTFDVDCLADYIRYGLEETENGYCLKYQPEIEYAIYRSLPHDLPSKSNLITVPVSCIYGENSKVVTPYDVRYMQRSGIKCFANKGTHMFPFEYPLQTAEKVRYVIEGL